MTAPLPPELPDGQDDGHPDMLLAVLAVTRLLHDLRVHLDDEDDDFPTRDLRARIRAMTAVLHRVQKRLEERRP